jgi:hypothetical protein
LAGCRPKRRHRAIRSNPRCVRGIFATIPARVSLNKIDDSQYVIMKLIKRTGLLLFICSSLLACKKPDNEKIIGRWQNDRDWFDYKNDNTYSSGKDDIKMVDHFKYALDPNRHELNMYTDQSNTTYYLIYEFKGDDTLAVRNAMSTVKTMIYFTRVTVKKND